MAEVSTIQDFKNAFFSSEIVQRLLGPAEKKALGQMGGYIRKTARNSLKYGDVKSSPGKPPTVHKFFTKKKVNSKTGAVTAQTVSPLKEFLFYAFDESNRSTVVGPAIFSSQAKRTRGRGPVPGTLEKGGTVSTSRDEPISKGGRRAGPRQYAAFLAGLKDGKIVRKPGATRTVTTSKSYAPRPFMAPALKASMPKFSKYFASTGG
jgi:hypothetical protein